MRPLRLHASGCCGCGCGCGEALRLGQQLLLLGANIHTHTHTLGRVPYKASSPFRPPPALGGRKGSRGGQFRPAIA